MDLNHFWETSIPKTGIGEIIDTYSNKKRFLAWGKGENECLLELVSECVKRNKTAVYLLPSMDDYPPIVKRAIALGGSNFHLYEIEMGMSTVLNSRAHKYLEYWPESFLVGRL